MESTFNLFDSLGAGFTASIGWFGELLDAMLTPTGALIAAFALISVGFGISFLGKAFGWVRGMLWGY